MFRKRKAEEFHSEFSPQKFLDIATDNRRTLLFTVEQGTTCLVQAQKFCWCQGTNILFPGVTHWKRFVTLGQVSEKTRNCSLGLQIFFCIFKPRAPLAKAAYLSHRAVVVCSIDGKTPPPQMGKYDFLPFYTILRLFHFFSSKSF